MKAYQALLILIVLIILTSSDNIYILLFGAAFASASLLYTINKEAKND